MAKSKTEDNKNKLINIRLNEYDYRLFKLSASSIGATPSELIRMYISTSINPLKVKVQQGEINLDELERVLIDENK